MELYGTPLDDEAGDRRSAVREVTIIAPSESLRHLAKFLEQAADEIDELGTHFGDATYEYFASRDLGHAYRGGDIRVLNPSYALGPPAWLSQENSGTCADALPAAPAARDEDAYEELRARFAEVRKGLTAAQRGDDVSQLGEPLLVLRAVTYWSRADENAFFRWLDELGIVASYRGQGMDLLVSLHPERMTDEAVSELVALLQRYQIVKSDGPLDAGLTYDFRLANEGAFWDVGLYHDHD
jgi:hypothetical protein